MRTYRAQPAQPREIGVRPLYPRLLGLGVLVAAAACGGSVVEDAPDPIDGTGGTAGSGGTTATGGSGGTDNAAGWGSAGGGAPMPYDGGPGGEGGAAGQGGGGTGGYGTGGGGAPYPYDADVPDVVDEEPPLAGEPPDPFEAGADAWPDAIDGEAPDADLSGFAPEPFDAGCGGAPPQDPNP